MPIFPWVLQLLQKIHHEFRKNVPGNFLCAVDCQEALVILELCLMMINAPEDTVNVVILTSSKFDDFLVRDNWRVLILTNF